MFGSKVVSMIFVIAIMFSAIDCKRLTIKELIIRLQFCQPKTCNKCAKLITTLSKNKTQKVKDSMNLIHDNLDSNNFISDVSHVIYDAKMLQA